MDTASISVVKKELKNLDNEKLIELCLRLAKHKKENKELLSYLLFEADLPEIFIKELKNEIESEFKDINTSSLYFVKKSLRRILRMVTKHIKFSADSSIEVELLIFYCRQIISLNLPMKESKVILNLYNRQILNIEKALKKLHEDLRFDFQEDFNEVKMYLRD